MKLQAAEASPVSPLAADVHGELGRLEEMGIRGST